MVDSCISFQQFHLNERFVRVKLCQPGWVLHGIAANISYTDWRIMLNLSDPTHEFIDGASEIHAHRITLSRTYIWGLEDTGTCKKKKKPPWFRDSNSLHNCKICKRCWAKPWWHVATVQDWSLSVYFFVFLLLFTHRIQPKQCCRRLNTKIFLV